MECAAHTPGGCGGVSQAVGKEFVGDDTGTIAQVVQAVTSDDVMAPPAPLSRAAGILFLTPEKKTLMLRNADGDEFPGVWGFPGGKQEDGETLEACARRECKEETGFDYAGELRQIFDDGQYCCFLARIDEPFAVTLDQESSGFAWVGAGEMVANSYPNVATILRIASADTELAIAELMRDGVLPSPQIYANIYLVDIRITGTGVAFRSKLGEHVYRDPSLYLNPEFLARCNGLPVILDHPDSAVLNASEFENRISGTCMLPYIKGDEVWSIARIYAKDAIEAINSGEISTSPAVVFTNDSGNVKVSLENGDPLLIEGKPALIDHIALVSQARGALGVWDKGGEAAGVSLQNEVITMADEKGAAEDKKADDAKADASGGQTLDKVLAGIDSMGKRMDEMSKRMDAMESTRVADRKDDDEDEKEKEEKKDARKDDDDDAKKDDDSKKDDEDREEKEEKKADDDAGYADAQVRADRVYAAFGDHAPRPVIGETLIAYRRRLAKKFQVHSPTYKDINLGAIADAALLSVAENQIYADAAIASRNPIDIADGALIEIKRTDATGRQISEFRGTPHAWMAPFKAQCRRVSAINKGGL